jgi:lipoprotein-anchoring transpeptidase ErfK/SrfK
MLRRRTPYRLVAAIATAVLITSATAACSTASERLNGRDDGAGAPSSAPSTSVAEVVVSPPTGAADVAPDVPVTVTVEQGQLRSVVLTGPSGAVEGTLSTDRASWSSNSPLSLAASYTLVATAVDPNGVESTTTSTFQTIAPTKEQTLDVSMSPLEGEVVGVGMPVVLYLSDPVEDAYRAAVEAGFSVTSEPSVEGSWHWISSTELHWRPKELWPAGTRVSVDLSVEGIHAGESLWGGPQDGSLRKVGTFAISDVATTSVVNLAEKSLKVYQDGALVRTLPITAGKPGWETRNGTKVILEKHRDITMDGDSVGIDPGDPEYYRLDVEYALRVTWSGEFLHAAPWSVGQQGADLVSHGCVGMSTEDAAWLFDISTRGDVVTVTGSPRDLEKGNGYTDWNYGWDEWIAGSALHGTSPSTPAPTGTPID